MQRSILIKHNSRKKVNDVNEWSATGRPVLSGRDCHVLLVTIDHHQALAREMTLTSFRYAHQNQPQSSPLISKDKKTTLNYPKFELSEYTEKESLKNVDDRSEMSDKCAGGWARLNPFLYCSLIADSCL